MQNDTPIMVKWARLKPEVEFQHGGRLYFEIGNSYISAANGDIWTKLCKTFYSAVLSYDTIYHTKLNN